MTEDTSEKPIELKAQPSVLHAVIHITRANTGKVETYTITSIDEPPTEKEQDK